MLKIVMLTGFAAEHNDKGFPRWVRYRELQPGETLHQLRFYVPITCALLVNYII